jgi:ribose transport system substrate-binding protein
MTGKQLEASYKIPTDVVDKSNYKEYMASDLYKIRYSI